MTTHDAERMRMALAEVAPELHVWSLGETIHATPAGGSAPGDDHQQRVVVKAYDTAGVPDDLRCWVCASVDEVRP